jgi:hypothetical protein
MTLEQLEQRLTDLEREVAELRRELRPLKGLGDMPETFGMFREDPQFDEIIRLGREYRDQVNSEDLIAPCLTTGSPPPANSRRPAGA